MTTEPQDQVLPDSSKACLSLFYFACAVILPSIGFLIGWQGWDMKTGGYVALATFGVFIFFSGIFISMVQSPSWVMVAGPLIIGILYAAFPDPILGPFDDVAVNLGGALITFMLWIKKQPSLPRWVIIPLLATGVYAAVGYFIPGPIDEIIVALIAIMVAAIGAANAEPAKDDAPPVEIKPETPTFYDPRSEASMLAELEMYEESIEEEPDVPSNSDDAIGETHQ
jgi:hypothetical protein